VAFRYILEDRKPVPCDDVMQWARWYENADRRVCVDMVGRVEVSTFFIGVDVHCLFETMVFDGGPMDGKIWRYPEWDVAEAGHKVMVALVQDMVYRFQRYDALRLHDRYLRFPKPKRAPTWRPCTFL
jgi:hypothetical protein